MLQIWDSLCLPVLVHISIPTAIRFLFVSAISTIQLPFVLSTSITIVYTSIGAVATLAGQASGRWRVYERARSRSYLK